MKFHEVHGLNVEVDQSRRVARRVSSFCDAFVFSEAPLHLNSMTVVRVQSPKTEWSGHAFLGVTSKNPLSFVEDASLKHIISLLNAEDVWIRPIQPHWSASSLVVHLTYDGQLEIIVDHEPNVRYCLLENLPVNFPLWLVVEVYGATSCVTLPTYDQPNSHEIVALGSDVHATYKCGKEGVMPYQYARLVLIGPKNAGKTTLKTVLASSADQQHQDNSDSQSGRAIETDEEDLAEPSRFYLAQGSSPWNLLTSTAPNRVLLTPTPKSEIYHNLASNIAHEIVLNEREQQAIEMSNTAGNNNPGQGTSGTGASTVTTRDLIWSVFKFSGSKKQKKSYTKEVKQLSETTSDIPEELMFLIEDKLKKGSGQGTVATSEEAVSAPAACLQRILHVSDLSGDLSCLVVNQLLFTSCAVYVFVFDLSHSLDAPVQGSECVSFVSELSLKPLSLLDTIHLWVSFIHATIATFPTPSDSTDGEAENVERSDETAVPQSGNVQPQVVLVGTHRNSVHAEPIMRNQMVKEKFETIFASFEGKMYASNLQRSKYIALDTKDMAFDEPDLVDSLRKLLDELIVSERVTGFNIPLPWLQLGQMLDKLRQRGIYFVDINQLHEVASTQIDCFQSYDNLNAALHFYHNQARIFYLDCLEQHTENIYSGGALANGMLEGHPLATEQRVNADNNYELGVIILDSSWFMSAICQLCQHILFKISAASAENAGHASLNEEENDSDDDDRLAAGLITETIINQAWASCLDQKFILLGCLENLDIMCELSPYIQLEDAADVGATNLMPKLYFFPWITKSVSCETDLSRMSNCELEDVMTNATVTNEHLSESTFQFVAIFDVLPVALFSRLLIRLSKWSWSQGWGRKPEVINMKARIAVDFDYDVILRVNLNHAHIFILIVKIFDELQNDQIENLLMGPTANVCVKVQHLVESELELLRVLYYRRLSFKLVVPCPCDAPCELHRVDGCLEEDCLHFLSLSECVKRKVIECKHHRQVRTAFIQRYLPYMPASNSPLDNLNGGGEMLFDTLYSYQGHGDVWDNLFQEEPMWMREAAKMLDSSRFKCDWMALAKRLSYSERDVSKFTDEVSPSLAILKDWYESNGRTRYCIDVLISCLRMLGRDDIASLIEYELEPETVSLPIFISYHRDSQKQVLEIRRKLELSGFPCWMDTSSIGGGESLYGKIYEGISRAKVFICCLTPRYLASPMCNREVTLADVLHKPILPLIIEFTPWPPPGAMALIMSSIVYIDMCGVGSHSGIGRLQDSESLFRDILERVTRYTSGYSDAPIVSSSRYLQLPDLFAARARNEQHMMGYDHHHHRDHRHQQHRNHVTRMNAGRAGPRSFSVYRRHATEARSVSSTRSNSTNVDNASTANNGGDGGNLSAEVMLLMERSAGGRVGNMGNDSPGVGSMALADSSDEAGRRTARDNAWSQRQGEEVPFGEDIISGDNISVLSRSRMANRITSCAVCRLM